MIVIFDDTSYLSMFISAIIHAIYPLKWVHTIIPVLPLGLCDVVQSPWPYILGIYGEMFEVLSSGGMYDFSDTLVVDLGKSKLFVPSLVSEGTIGKRKKSVVSKKKMMEFKGKVNK